MEDIDKKAWKDDKVRNDSNATTLNICDLVLVRNICVSAGNANSQINRTIYYYCRSSTQSAPNCIKDFLDLPDHISQSGLNLQLFPMVILVNQVWLETIVTSNLIGQNKLIGQ